MSDEICHLFVKIKNPEYTEIRKNFREVNALNSQNENITQNLGEGYLTVRVTTARGAIPLDGATVTVTGKAQDNSGVKQVFHTGGDGLTQKISLPAPPRENSESPNNGVPFYTYNLEIIRDGYYNQTYQNIPVFDGINAMQTAELIPLPKNGIPDRLTIDSNRFFEGQNPDL